MPGQGAEGTRLPQNVSLAQGQRRRRLQPQEGAPGPPATSLCLPRCRPVTAPKVSAWGLSSLYRCRGLDSLHQRPGSQADGTWRGAWCSWKGQSPILSTQKEMFCGEKVKHSCVEMRAMVQHGGLLLTGRGAGPLGDTIRSLLAASRRLCWLPSPQVRNTRASCIPPLSTATALRDEQHQRRVEAQGTLHHGHQRRFLSIQFLISKPEQFMLKS